MDTRGPLHCASLCVACGHCSNCDLLAPVEAERVLYLLQQQHHVDDMASSSAAQAQQCSQVGGCSVLWVLGRNGDEGREICWRRHLLETNKWQNVRFHIIESVCGEFMLHLCTLSFAVFSVLLILYKKKQNPLSCGLLDRERKPLHFCPCKSCSSVS